jgi:hypothetical protein
LTALTLSAFAGASARAEGSAVTVEQPGEAIEVIVVRAKRPATLITDEAPATEATGEITMAWQEPGFVEEVIVVTASRSEGLAAMRAEAWRQMQARAAQGPRFSGWNSWAGMPRR